MNSARPPDGRCGRSDAGSGGPIIVPRVCFTPNLQRHVECPPCEAAGSTVREVLEAVFAANARARGYVLDDRGALRKHMSVFVNGSPLCDREGLSDPVPEGAEVYVFQALSGG
jgi:molybdopterin synthase sulfur carrier subunit